jgi:folate-binding protein YgfZ
MGLAERLEAARTGSAVGPVEAPGVLRASGLDAARFLHRVSAQDLARLRAGEAAWAAFLEARGRLVADALVLAREDDLLLLLAVEAVPSLLAHLRKYAVMDRVTLEDLGGALRCLAVLGAKGVAALDRSGPAAVLDDPRRGAPAASVLVAAAEAEAFRTGLVAGGATALDAADLEALRVEAGLPRFGADMDGDRLALEAGLVGAAVRLDKGCYIGQEVMLRGTYRGQVQRGLVQLELPGGASPGAALLAGGREVGRVTSAAETPAGRLGLGYLRRAHWREGERLATDGGEAVVRRALVAERD